MPSNPPTIDAEIVVFPNRVLGQVSGRLWGQFVELAGRCINEGLYEPGSPRSGPDGVREDVLEALRELQPTHLRYPGGCATSYFDWQELVGPREQRPKNKLFRSTGGVQSTAFGIPEAFDYCQRLGCELYLTVNAHTQSPEDAANLVEYLNSDKPTKWADLRRSHGREQPYNVKLFGLGNEIYGDWQAGAKTAEEYIAWCKEAISQMKCVDPTIDIVCVGLGRPGPDWDRKVLKGLVDRIDMLSIHNYCGRPVFKDCMAAYRIYEEMFNWLNVAIDEAMDSLPSRKKRIGLAFDEWNVWYRSKHAAYIDLEEVYDYADALTVATIMHVMLRNTRSVYLSNISLAVNTCGSIFTDTKSLVRQTIFYPQKLYRAKHSGAIVDTAVDAPVFAAKHERYFCGIVDVEKAKDETLPSLLHYSDIPALDALTSVDRSRRRICVSVVQKLEDRPLTTRIDFKGATRPTGTRMKVHTLTSTGGIRATNTLATPNNVGLTTETRDATDTFTFPPASLTLLEYELA